MTLFLKKEINLKLAKGGNSGQLIKIVHLFCICEKIATFQNASRGRIIKEYLL